MTAVELSAAPLIGLWCVYMVITRRCAAAILPGLGMGGVFIVMGLWGARLWNWSRANNGAGLPASFTADGRMDSPAVHAFMLAGLGAVLGGIIAAGASPRDRQDRPPRGVDDLISTLVLVLGVVLLIAWLEGQGPSVWRRAIYMQTDGNPTALKASSLLGPLAGVAAIVTSGNRPRWQRYISYSSGLVWYLLLTSVGSRVAVLFPLAGLAMVAVWSARLGLKGLLPLLIAAWGFSYLALGGFTVTQLVRGTPHGISLWWTNWTSPKMPTPFSLHTWSAPFQRLVSSVTASAAITGMSAAYPPHATVLLHNANPLPSSLLGNSVDPYSAERLWPIEWVPLAFVGEWFGAMGPWLQIVLFTSISGFSGFVASCYRRIGFTFGYALTLALPIFLCVIAIQYPSRMFWRAVTILAVMPIGLVVPPAMAMIVENFRKVNSMRKLGQIPLLMPALVAVLAILGSLCALGYSTTVPKTYAASNQVLVASNPSGVGNSSISDASALIAGEVQNFQALISTPLVLEPAMKQIGMHESVTDVEGQVSGSATLNTSILEIRVTSSDPTQAAQLANATQRSLVNTIATVGPKSASNVPLLKATVVSTATTPAAPSSPNRKLYALGGLVLGGLLGIAVCFGIRRHTTSRMTKRGAHPATDETVS